LFHPHAAFVRCACNRNHHVNALKRDIYPILKRKKEIITP
jgi:hypothetical protein